MKICRNLSALLASLLCVATVAAQEPPKPGPEHVKLKELEGNWDAIMKMGEEESKCGVTYKMELGGLWLVSDFKGEVGGMKFSGRGLDGYDPVKKKYVSVWADSMAASPVITEGTFDKTGKILTMEGQGPGPDGAAMKYKMVSEYKDKDSFLFTMYGPGPDGKEMSMFTITYKRKK